MSVILAFANSQYGIIASDGRFRVGNQIVNEDFDKTRVLNESVICGFAGYSQPCLQMISEITSNPRIQEMSLESIIEIVSIRLPKMVSESEFASFLLLGKNADNKIQITGIGTKTNYLPYTEIPTSERNCFMTISPPKVDSSEIFKSNLQKFYPDIQKSIDMTIIKVSQLTETVNKIRFQKKYVL